MTARLVALDHVALVDHLALTLEKRLDLGGHVASGLYWNVLTDMIDVLLAGVHELEILGETHDGHGLAIRDVAVLRRVSQGMRQVTDEGTNITFRPACRPQHVALTHLLLLHAILALADLALEQLAIAALVSLSLLLDPVLHGRRVTLVHLLD